MITKPLLATAADLDKVNYPVIGSPKLDGIRCLVINGCAVSRKFKPIPNDYIRTWIEENCAEGFDGEILMIDPTTPFKEVSSMVMSKTHPRQEEFMFAVFDWVYKAEKTETHFEVRIDNLRLWFDRVYDRTEKAIALHMNVVPQHRIITREALDLFHVSWVENGFEGTMIRDPKGIYKCGRSTVNQGILLKIKNWADEEAEVIGVVEEMQNNNEKTVDEVGDAKRSTHKANKVGKGTMGALHCRFADGTEFHLGTGFSAEERQEIWDRTDHDGFEVVGGFVKVKHQPDFGGRQPGQKPRFPTFLGFRNVEIDG